MEGATGTSPKLPAVKVPSTSKPTQAVGDAVNQAGNTAQQVGNTVGDAVKQTPVAPVVGQTVEKAKEATSPLNDAAGTVTDTVEEIGAGLP